MSKKQSTRLELQAESFALDREAGGCSVATLAWYRKYIGVLVEFLLRLGVRDITQVTSDHLRNYLVQIRGRKLSKRSVHHHASAARAFFNFAVNEGWIKEADNPMRRVTMPEVPKDIAPAFADRDIEKLASAACTDRDQAIVLFLVDSGVRLNQLVKLNIGDVDIKSGSVLVREGKGNKDRMTFIGVKARRALLRYMQNREDRSPEQALWVTPSGDRLAARGVSIMLKRLGEATGVKNCHPHTFRHTMATMALDNGMDVFALQAMMGHADLETLRKYINRQPSKLKAAHDKHGPLDGKA